jgi:protein-arginine kinase activator protein McsA
MLDNHKYNLLNQLSQESKSLWRIEQTYLADAEACDDCKATWKKVAEEKRKCIAHLETQVKEHMA